MQKLGVVGLLIFLVGAALVFAGTLTEGNVSAGGVVFIGPFPIVFGSGPGRWALALGSVVIGGIMLALLLLWGWRFSRMKKG